MRTFPVLKLAAICVLVSSVVLPLFAAQDKISQTDVRRYVREAEQEYGRGDLKKAGGYYFTVLDAFPEMTDIRFKLAGIYYELGELSNAAAAYEEALKGLEKEEEIAQAYKVMTIAYAQDAKYVEAVEAGRKAWEMNPQDPDVAVGLAIGLAKTGNLSEAADMAQQALALAPDNPMVHATLGEAALADANLDAASAAFARALELDADNAEAHAGMAEIFFQREEYEAAVESATRALDLNDQLTRAYGIRGKAKNALGQGVEAQADLTMAITVNPEDPEANLAYAQVLESLGNYGQAANYYSRAIQYNPSAFAAYAPLAEIYIAQQRYSELEQAMRQVLDSSPDNAYGHLYFGVSLDATQKTEEALAEFIKAAELDDSLAGAYYGRGKILRTQNDNANALVFLEKAVELDGDNDDYLTEYGIALFNTQQVDKAVAALEKAAATPDYNNILGWFALGNVYLSGQRYSEASVVLDKVVEASPNWGQAHRMAGWANYGQLGVGCPCSPEDEANAQKVVDHYAKMVEFGATDPDLQTRADALAKGGKVQ